MKKFLNIFFVILGIIFFIIILFLSYVYLTDTLGIKTLISGEDIATEEVKVNIATSNDTQTQDKNSLLNSSQEKTLESIGVNPSKLPNEITPEMQNCFEIKLGKDRADEINKGDEPTIVDFLKAQSCIK